MRIRDVIATKGGRVETVWPTQSVREIPHIFIDRNLASVVVVSTTNIPLGIITDRNILAAMAQAEGHLASGLTARDIMTSPVPVCGLDDGVVAILNRMTHERLRHLVVMDEGRMAGIVSIGDLVKHRFQDTDMEMRILRDMAFAHMAG